MNKVIVITGASRGIGRATALLAAKQGFAVCVNYLSNHQEANLVVAQINNNGGRAIAVAGDMSKDADVVALFKTVDEKLGRVTALVNNIGILHKQCRVEDMTIERLNSMFTTNITSHFLCSREAIKRMSTKYNGNGGTIVNVSSAAARIGSPHEYVDYAASKGAIDSFTKGLSLEVIEEGIRVNGVRPGFIFTDIHNSGGEKDRVKRLEPIIPMKRGGQPEEVARVIMWLVSDDSSYVAGNMIDVAGGR
jgi:NAD(P)-dependent dehydrogenase (short-subunit alcohol dehydrogenase family)